ncbi:UNVERIFIED_CONTAM: hypothetical protein Sradi_3648300 [Sesamum radiatum]|uniref:Zinc knuckle CX2CX4HX4C domain-containing protein n=1 Tax=Sesamum radiatum TaxID=300843 RepID=A0AAW2QIA1_SESRA
MSWCFEKNTLFFSGVGTNENPMNADLNLCNFFVHVHDLPLSKMTFDILSLTGNKIGRSCNMEMEESAKEKLVVSFTYEQLQNFGYLCGMLGHISKYCEERFVDGSIKPRENNSYGPWLRPSPRELGPNRSKSYPWVYFTKPGTQPHTESFTSEVPKTGAMVLDGQGQFEAVDRVLSQVASGYDQTPTGRTNYLGKTDDMVVEEGLVLIQVQFSASVGRGVALLRRRGQRRASLWGYVSLKHGRPVSVIELCGVDDNEAKHRHLLNEESNVILPEVARDLILLWRKDVNVIMHSYSISHIDSVVSKDDGMEGWRFTEVYGHLEATRRTKTWQLLWSLRQLPPRQCVNGEDLRFQSYSSHYLSSCLGTDSAGDQLICNLHNMRLELVTWENLSFGSVKRQVIELEEVLLGLTKASNSATNLSQRAELHEMLDELLAREEIMWKQRGKAKC